MQWYNNQGVCMHHPEWVPYITKVHFLHDLECVPYITKSYMPYLNQGALPTSPRFVCLASTK